MRNTLIALATVTGLGIAGLAAAPAAAAPLAPAQLGVAVQKTGNQVETAHMRRHVRRHGRHDVRRHIRRHHFGRPHLRRHFWVARPGRFGGYPYHNCVRVGHGFLCYY